MKRKNYHLQKVTGVTPPRHQTPLTTITICAVVQSCEIQYCSLVDTAGAGGLVTFVTNTPLNLSKFTSFFYVTNVTRKSYTPTIVIII